MTSEQEAKLRAKAQKIAGGISNWVAGVLFGLFMLGLADQLMNGILMWMYQDEFDFLARLNLELFGPINFAEKLRYQEFWSFAFFAVFLSLCASAIAYAVTYLTIIHGECTETTAEEVTE